MVYAHDAAQNVGPSEIIDGEIGAALVLVLEPAEALGLSRLLVAGEFDKDGLAKLRKDDNNVALGELVR
jgi:hypothetical protein